MGRVRFIGKRSARVMFGSRKRIAISSVSIIAVLSLGVFGAVAWFTSTGAGNASASVGSLAASSITNATPGAGTVSLTWSAITPPQADTVTYSVSRNGGDPAGDCPTAASPQSVLSCTDAGLNAGGYEYTVTAHWRTWTSTSSAQHVTVDSGTIDHFKLEAASTTPTAGDADNLTITAQDVANHTVTAYTGDKTLTFTGAATIGVFAPTVTDKNGNAVNFGAGETITFSSGVASVSGSNNGVMTLYKVGSPTISVGDGTTSGSLNVTVGAATAASLQLAAATTTPTAGQADNLTITAKDQYGNVATGYTGDKGLTFGGAGTIGAFHPTVSDKNGTAVSFGNSTTITFASGVATVSSGANGVMTLYKAESQTVTVTDGTISNAGLPTTVSPASAASLTLAAATTTPTAGVGDNLTITAKDPYGNTATGYTGDQSLIFSGANNAPDGTHPTVTNKSGTAINFGNATTITFASGVATTSGSSNGVMTLYKAESPTIGVTDGAISNAGLPVIVSAGTAASLFLQAASTTPTAGTADSLTISAKDTWQNTATGYTGDKSLTFSGAGNAPDGTHPTVTNKSGSAINFGNSTTITFAAGLATVSSGANGVMTLYKAESATIGVTDGTISNAGVNVTVSAGTAHSLVLAAATSTPIAGQADNLTITAKDTWLNVATGYTGDHSLTFGGANIAPDGSHHPTISDKNGSAVNFGNSTTITFSSGSASVSGSNNGVMTLYKAETASVTVSDGSINNGSGLSVTVSPAAANKLVFTQQPVGNVAEGVNFSTQPQVSVEDSFSNVVTGDSGSVTLAVNSYTAGNGGSTQGSVSNCTNNPVNASSGVATFVGCQITGTAGAGTYTLAASRGGLSTAVSNNVVINGGSASKLVFTTEPVAGVAEGVNFPTQPVVKVEDSFSNVVTGDSGSVTLTVNSYTAGNGGSTQGSVSNCTNNPVNASSGVATFAGCQITGTTGAGIYTLKATRSGLTQDASNDVVINSGTASSLTLAAATTTPTAGAADNLTITAKDSFGNTATGYTGSKNLIFSGASNAPDGTHPTVTDSGGAARNFGVGTSITFSSGGASVSGSNNGVMTLYKAETATIAVTDGTISNSGLNITVAAGTAAKLAWTGTPTVNNGTLAAGCLFACTWTSAGRGKTFTATVSVTDANGNVVNNIGTGHSVTFTKAQGGSWTSTSLALPATGSATTTSDTYTTDNSNSWTTDTITAASTGFTSATVSITK